LVDYRVTLDEQAGKLVRKPREEAQLETIRQLVVAASGAVAQRDTVTVESLPFTMLEEPPQVPAAPPDPADELFSIEWLRKYRPYFIAALVFVAVLLALGVYWKRRRRLAKIRLERQQAIEAEREKLRLEAAEKEHEESRRLEEERMLKGFKVAQVTNSKTQALKKHLEGVAGEDPAMFARMVKAWLHEDD
jgi:flagellar biosynthesis/type III secretory pathway M-ring protein FliF/YscJ